MTFLGAVSETCYTVELVIMKTRKAGKSQKTNAQELPSSGLGTPSLKEKTKDRSMTEPVHGKRPAKYGTSDSLAAAKRLFSKEPDNVPEIQEVQVQGETNRTQQQFSVAPQSEFQVQEEVIRPQQQFSKPLQSELSKKTLKINEKFQASQFYNFNESGPSGISLFAEDENSEEELVIVRRKRKPSKVDNFAYDPESSGDEQAPSGLEGFTPHKAISRVTIGI